MTSQAASMFKQEEMFKACNDKVFQAVIAEAVAVIQKIKDEEPMDLADLQIEDKTQKIQILANGKE